MSADCKMWYEQFSLYHYSCIFFYFPQALQLLCLHRLICCTILETLDLANFIMSGSVVPTSLRLRSKNHLDAAGT